MNELTLSSKTGFEGEISCVDTNVDVLFHTGSAKLSLVSSCQQKHDASWTDPFFYLFLVNHTTY